MPTSEHGEFEENTKSPYSFEYYDSSWELELMKELEKIGFVLAFPTRRASHEFIITAKPLMQKTGITALDIAKRLLDFGIHAPTIYFPLLISECLLIEPTETESKETLDRFVSVMKIIYDEAHTHPDRLKNAPQQTPVGRLDEVRAARELVISGELVT